MNLKSFRIVAAIVAALFVAPLSLAELKAGDQAFLPNMKDVDSGKMVKLSSLKGKVVYIDFWAEWCVTCRKSFPIYNELAAELKNDGVIFIGVNTDSDVKLAKKFLAKTPADFINVHDADNSVVQTYEPAGFPTAYIVNKEGKIVAVHSGQPKKAELKAELLALTK